ncbi:ASCH domain-containing protein [Levilactobacillus andaensis]|uniref:ASCH domain-containing protein n=1 Tax=Levilactobacillus andaensis TaxID=2799570 RepID=UPI0019415608|nr:ASCH domain-containing protein [Levilactobacillus andaensis]
MTVEEFWQQFKNSHPEVTTNDYDAYAFVDADALAHLVKIGRKTATTSALDLYDENDARPQVGEYSIILDSQNQPVCVTQTKVVETIPFDQVSAEHAYHEGEGDRTLAYWRDVHRRVFSSFYQQCNREFNEQISCLCEVFERVD